MSECVCMVGDIVIKAPYTGKKKAEEVKLRGSIRQRKTGLRRSDHYRDALHPGFGQLNQLMETNSTNSRLATANKAVCFEGGLFLVGVSHLRLEEDFKGLSQLSLSTKRVRAPRKLQRNAATSWLLQLTIVEGNVVTNFETEAFLKRMLKLNKRLYTHCEASHSTEDAVRGFSISR